MNQGMIVILIAVAPNWGGRWSSRVGTGDVLHILANTALQSA